LCDYQHIKKGSAPWMITGY